jgi:hypothetical protein
MLARALIVLLVVLNLGVAIWWVARGDGAPTPAVEAQPAGVARLQLLREAAPAAAHSTTAPAPSTAQATPDASASDAAAREAAGPAPARVTQDPATTAATPAPQHCYAIGPFADAAAGDAARRRLQPAATRLHVRTETATAPRRDWRVWLPPLADRAAAQAMAGRIAAAGFDDYFIVAAGDEANSIALGRYRSEESARRREAALRAGGFADVRAEPLGEEPPPSKAWIDIAAAAPLAADTRAALGGAGVESIDCGRVP